mgnify:CR=1 FL=1
MKNISKLFLSTQKKFLIFGKVLMRPSHTVLKSQPVEPWTRIFFSAWRNVLMSGNVGDGVMAAQCGAQAT